MKKYFIILLVLILPYISLSQIKIEERVEIAPQQILSDDPQFGLELGIGVYPSLLAPGDIREIGLSLCERRSFYGCYIIDFPQGQLFDAAITWDPFPGENEYNTPKLVSGTQVSDTLLGAEEGFYFKAPEYLTVSYMVAVLEVKTYISGYGLIQDDYLVSMMLDTSLVISFNPTNISPSDTSEIVIEKIRYDGVKIPYHPLQQFEVGIIEGCTAGKLLAAGDTASYFNRVTQPIYFVAADSIDEEEDTLKIRVGLNQELIDTYLPLKIKYEKQLAKQEKEERGELKVTEEEKPVEQNPTDNPMISSCSFSTFESFLYEDVTKTLQDECEDYICNEVILKPSFTFEYFPNGTFNEDPCTVEQSKYTDTTVTGIFSPLWNRTIITAIQYFKIENLSACYQPLNGKWKFGTRLPLYPYYQAIMDVCLTNITNKGFRYLYDISEIDSVWGDPDICKAKKDLEGHKKYPSKIRAGGYIFLDVEMAHEMAHGQDYQWVIDSLQNAFLYPTLDFLEVTCGNYDQENNKASNQDEAKQIYFKYLQKVIAGEKSGEQVTFLGFEDRLYDGYDNHINQSYTVNGIQVDHENYINSRPIVTNTINVIISEFENIYGCN